MTENEKAYWDKRDRIIDADFIWLAQRHVTNTIESLSERGYDRNSDTVRELQSIVDRLTKLAVVVQTGLEEATNDHGLADKIILAYKKEDAIHDQHLDDYGLAGELKKAHEYMDEVNADEDREDEVHHARYGF